MAESEDQLDGRGREDLAREIWEKWRREAATPAEALVHASALRPEQVAALVVADQRERWERGAAIPAETYLEQYPGLARDPESVVDVIYGEYLLREERGERPRTEDFLKRFGSYRGPLGRQFELRAGLGRDDAQPVARIGRFEIREPLGVGASGYVFRAFDEEHHREVALRILHRHPLPERERFLEGARAASGLAHPHVASILAYGIEPEGAYVAYELISGRTLEEVFEEGPRPAKEVAGLVHKLALAMGTAARQGVPHPDLSPSRVLIDDGGEPRITDYGVPAPPGRCRAGGRAETDGDLCRLGLILYQGLAGRLPFGGSATDVLARLGQGHSPRGLGKGADRDLEAICLQALEVGGGVRYDSVGELAGDLGRYLAGRHPRARRRGVWRRLIHRVR